ncbi:peptidase M16 [Stenomitos frigidus ULC18]|uniref:Peptidase M16 n=2 Tax=Stenomitos TaxID=1844270 RepID=A0A2T1ELW6_9CYAN|nr:peptidase M16 [Stenomitos frigidus ULC18]
MVVLAWENPAADIVAARIFIRAGSQWETAQQAGLSHLLSAVLTKGTEQRSSLAIAEEVESVGASLGADSATDYFLLSLKTVSADFAEMLALAGELLRSPSFPQQEIDLERRLTLQAIRSQQEQPFSIAFDQLRRIMYGEHPYALSGLGTEASVAQLERTDLQRYHQAHFRPDNIVISLSGRLQSDDAIALVEQVFGDWQAPSTSLPVLSLPAITSQPVRAAIAQETQQSIVMLGYLAPALIKEEGANSGNHHTPSVSLESYTALKLLNSYLGNGLSSRLFVELREKRGLAYDVSAFYPTRLHPAQFVVYMGTAPENTAIALDGLKTEVDRLRTHPFSAETLQAAKEKILGQHALGKQTNAQIAQTFGWYETVGLGIGFDVQFQEQMSAVTLAEIQTVADRYLVEPYISLVGPAAVVKE